MKVISAFALAVLVAPGAQAAVALSNWFVQAQSSARAHTETVAGGQSIDNHSDNECNGTSYNCTSSAGFVGRHDAAKTTAETNASASGYLDAVYGGPGNTSASSHAKADLTTGKISIYEGASSPRGEEFTSAGVLAQFYDTLHFDLSGYSAPVAMTVKLRVDGSFDGYTQPRFGFSLSNGVNALSTGTVGWADTNPAGPSTTADAAFIDFGGGTGRAGSWSIYGPDQFVGTFYLDPAHPTATIAMYLSAGGPSNSYTAFDHTAAIDFLLPGNVTFTSDSGDF